MLLVNCRPNLLFLPLNFPSDGLLKKNGAMTIAQLTFHDMDMDATR